MNSKSYAEADQQRKYVFRPNDEVSQSLSKLCYGNFFVLGGIWIELMKHIMVGKKSGVIPKMYNNKNVITTAKQEDIARGAPETYEAYPDKACKNKYIDMPFEYKKGFSRLASHYQAYKESSAKWYGTENKDNMINKCLVPYVNDTRMNMLKKWKGSHKYISDTINYSKCMTKNKITNLREHVADPANCVKEKVCMSLSVATGAIIGLRKGYSRAIFNGGLGAMTSGLFCLHKKTKEFFRNLLLRSMVPEDRRNLQEKSLEEKRVRTNVIQ